jgi:2-C-methyl-D-erythritol 4-phosphate cytidylyltransferase
MNNVAVILAAGDGKRTKSYIPKQFMSLNGKLVYQYAVESFYDSKLFDKILMVIDKKYTKLITHNKMIDGVIIGGYTRNESIYNAIKYVETVGANTITFHDAARPFIKSQELYPYIDGLKNNDAVITAVKITDALFCANRDKYKLIQTPESFNFNYLKSKFNPDKESIAIYEHIYPARIKCVELNHSNLKLTYARDIYIAEQLMKYKEVVNRISDVKNKEILILGGTGGIGQAIAKELTELGAKVIVAGSHDINLDCKDIKLPNYKWDCIIHSAGTYATDQDGLIRNYESIMNVNFRSIVYLVEHVKNILKKNGNIICIGSTASVKGREGIALYSASKAALNCFIEGISSFLYKEGFKINAICPAKVATDLQKRINPHANFKDMIQPKDLAKLIIRYVDIESTGNIVYVRVGEEHGS